MFSKVQNINLTVGQENVGSLLFLAVKICRKNGKFITSVYKKQSFNGVFSNYESFITAYRKRPLLHTLIHRCFSICCNFKIFQFKIDHLKTILIKSNYPLNFIDLCIKSFLDRLNALIEKMFLLSYRSWEVFLFKIKKSFKII